MKYIRIMSNDITNSRIDIRQAEYEKRKQDYFQRTYNQAVALIERSKDDFNQAKA